MPGGHVAGGGTLEAVGRALFTDYLLAFEVASVLLLAAVIGAITLAKKKI
jgi:NADH-quinone oxidoreductase subunit J